MKTVLDKIRSEARARQTFRPSDLKGTSSNPRVYLKRLVDSGEVQHLGWGLYAAANAEPSGEHSLVEAAGRLPSGVICLLSALVFHQFTTQNPFEVWMAFQSNFTPAKGAVPIRAVRMSGRAFEHGIEEHVREGVKLRVYTPAKTVADCFRFRNKVGLDVALEALREGWRERRFTIDELWEAASACRVQSVIRPYAEAIVTP